MNKTMLINQKKAFITGITGQDGSYLAKFLLKKEFKIFGTTRCIKNKNLNNLKKLNIENKIKFVQNDLINYENLFSVLIDIKPDFIFHFACQSSVSLSFKFPFESFNSGTIATLNILECIKNIEKEIRLFLPVSSECFGNIDKNNPANELSPHNPISPYAVAKSSSYWLAKTYRDSYNLFVAIGFMSNHESPLRGEYYVIRKLIKGLKELKNNQREYIAFGDLSVIRDWGWAPLYVEAIYKMILNDEPDDFIIASGCSYKLEEIVRIAFNLHGFNNFEKYIKRMSNKRPNEISSSYLDPSKANKILNWKHSLMIEEMLIKLINNELF